MKCLQVVALMAVLVSSSRGFAATQRDCIDAWGPLNWYVPNGVAGPSGQRNNDWAATCHIEGFNAESVAALGQNVLCFEFSGGPLRGRVFIPSYAPPALMPACPPNNTDPNHPMSVRVAHVVYKDCLTPNQTVRFGGKDRPIEEASRTSTTVTTLASRPGLEGARVAEQTIQRFIATPFTGLIYLITLANGTQIELTGNHPMVRDHGQVVQADTLRSGDALLRVDGDIEAISSIERKPYDGNVWTVRPHTEKKIENIVIVKDILTGSARFTEQWSSDTTRLIRARTINVRGL